MSEPKPTRLEKICTLLKKRKEIINSENKGKIEINFKDSKTTISVQVFDETESKEKTFAPPKRPFGYYTFYKKD